MTKKNNFKRSIYLLLKYNRDGSFETQRSRARVLRQVAEELHQAGYKLSHLNGLKQKHVKYLNKSWQKNDLAVSTIKNRNAILRWVSVKINRRNLVPTNTQLNTGSRVYVINHSRATDIHSQAIEKISNEYVKVQIHLQRYLGLRREESIKFKPHLADHKTYIKLEASWCKGGRERTVPILSEEARYWINEAKKLAKTKSASLIPPEKSYIKARRVYDKQLQRAGVKYPHGFRHAYAHERYQQLTGWKCPACGGLTADQLTAEQKLLDRDARLTISAELGHARPQITVAYLGR